MDEVRALIEPEVPAAAPADRRRIPQVQELIGLDQPAATRLFGTAAERSEEPPATIWRYKTANCELDLFFYLDLRRGGCGHCITRSEATPQIRPDARIAFEIWPPERAKKSAADATPPSRRR